MKVEIKFSLEIKQNKKKSPAPQKPTAQSKSLKNTVIINHK